jgi:hypothetical protein
VTDLQATLIVTRDSIKVLRASSSTSAVEAYKSLPQLVDKTQTHINHLLEFSQSKLLEGTGKFSFRTWNKQTETRLSEFKRILVESHQQLHMAIASANV